MPIFMMPCRYADAGFSPLFRQMPCFTPLADVCRDDAAIALAASMARHFCHAFDAIRYAAY